MGLLNTTIFCGLILTNYIDNSPLKIFPHRSFFPSLTFHDFKLSHFSNTALFFQIRSSLFIRKSHFSNFLKTPIVEKRPPIGDFVRHCDPSRRSHPINIEERTFQICSTDFEADTDNVNSSGGALFYDDRQDSITITQCNFAYCHAGINGGAIFIENVTNLHLRFNLFQDCTTGFIANRKDPNTAKGGAIFANCISCTIVACDFIRCTINYENIKRYGGALYFARCTSVSPQRLEIFLSNFDRCGSISANLGVDHGGAIYVNCTNSRDSRYLVNISYTNFTNCVYNEGGSIVEVVGDTAQIYLSHAKFYRDDGLSMTDHLNYYCVNVSKTGSNSNATSKIKLYNIVLDDNYNKGSDVYITFHFLVDNCDIDHNSNDVGSIYLSKDTGQYVLLNKNPLNMINYVNLYPMNQYSYPFIPALNDEQVFKPFPTPMQTPLPSRSQIITEPPTQQPATPSNPTASSPLTQPSQLPSGNISPSNNGSADSSNSGNTKSGSLSTAAIVLIVLACIIVLITIIMISVLCVRNGRCGGSRTQIQDVRTVDNDESIRRFTYF